MLKMYFHKKKNFERNCENMTMKMNPISHGLIKTGKLTTLELFNYNPLMAHLHVQVIVSSTYGIRKKHFPLDFQSSLGCSARVTFCESTWISSSCDVKPVSLAIG